MREREKMIDESVTESQVKEKVKRKREKKEERSRRDSVFCVTLLLTFYEGICLNHRLCVRVDSKKPTMKSVHLWRLGRKSYLQVLN